MKNIRMASVTMSVRTMECTFLNVEYGIRVLLIGYGEEFSTEMKPK